MFVKHLQEFLGKFTMGQTNHKGNAISEAKIIIKAENVINKLFLESRYDNI